MEGILPFRGTKVCFSAARIQIAEKQEMEGTPLAGAFRSFLRRETCEFERPIGTSVEVCFTGKFASNIQSLSPFENATTTSISAMRFWPRIF